MRQALAGEYRDSSGHRTDGPIVAGLFGGFPSTKPDQPVDWQSDRFFGVLDFDRIEWHARYARGDYYIDPSGNSLIRDFAQDLIEIYTNNPGRPFVLVASGTLPALAALEARKQISPTGDQPPFPIVMATLGNPAIEETFAEYRADPQTNAAPPEAFSVLDNPDPAPVERLLDLLLQSLAPGGSGEYEQLVPGEGTRNVVAVVSNASNPGARREEQQASEWADRWNNMQERAQDQLLIRPTFVHLSCSEQKDSTARGDAVTYNTDAVVEQLMTMPDLKVILIIGDAASRRYRNAILACAEDRHVATGWESLAARSAPGNRGSGTVCFAAPREELWNRAAHMAVLLADGWRPQGSVVPRATSMEMHLNTDVVDKIGAVPQDGNMWVIQGIQQQFVCKPWPPRGT